MCKLFSCFKRRKPFNKGVRSLPFGVYARLIGHKETKLLLTYPLWYRIANGYVEWDGLWYKRIEADTSITERDIDLFFFQYRNKGNLNTLGWPPKYKELLLQGTQRV